MIGTAWHAAEGGGARNKGGRRKGRRGGEGAERGGREEETEKGKVRKDSE